MTAESAAHAQKKVYDKLVELFSTAMELKNLRDECKKEVEDDDFNRSLGVLVARLKEVTNGPGTDVLALLPYIP